MDSDGMLDACTSSWYGGRAAVWYGDGSGGVTATPLVVHQVGSQRLFHALPVDADGDGTLDLVTSLVYQGSGLWWARGAGSRSFEPSIQLLSAQFLRANSCDLNGDGNPEIIATSTASEVWIVEDVTTPPTAPVATLNGQGTWTDSMDYDGNGLIDILAATESGLWAIPQHLEDCNNNGLPDPDDIATGTSLDCNANGIPDECDVLQPSLDCDANGLLDSCELAAGTANDCDANGLIDSCEIGADAGLDVNANGVLDACECLVENYCIAQGNSAGTIASISSSGQPPSLGLNLFGLQVQGAPPQKFGLFFFGTQDHFALLGEGALCVKPPLKRIYPLLVTDSSGATSLQLDLWPGPAPLDNIQPGQSRYFQFWYRDPLGGPAGFNFSDGLKVTFCP
jgi:hypothetical protein